MQVLTYSSIFIWSYAYTIFSYSIIHYQPKSPTKSLPCMCWYYLKTTVPYIWSIFFLFSFFFSFLRFANRITYYFFLACDSYLFTGFLFLPFFFSPCCKWNANSFCFCQFQFQIYSSPIADLSKLNAEIFSSNILQDKMCVCVCGGVFSSSS